MSHSLSHFSHRPCPISGSHEVTFLYHQDFCLPENHPLKNGYDLVCSLESGFVFADTLVTQNEYDRFYAEYSKYEDGKTSTGTGHSPFDHERLITTAERISHFTKNKFSQILDIGCANGGLLLELQKNGFHNLNGIDPSPICVENILKNPGINAWAGGLFNPQTSEKYDLIILSHVLEHVNDIRGALTTVSSLLSPEGLIYIEVPDATRYIDYCYSPFQDINTEHINHFSQISLENLASLCGFEILSRGDLIIFSSPKHPYPALYQIWKKTENTSPKPLIQDHQLSEKISLYLKQSLKMMKNIDQTLLDFTSPQIPIIVWGTGQLVMKLLAYTSLAKAKIIAFTDGNPINWGKTINGVPVIPPQKIQDSDIPIVITSLLH